jgi:hypothetical protein
MIGLAVAVALAASSPARLPPVDRCQGDPAFDQFRAALGDAVARKDSVALQALAASDIRASFGGDGGWKEFASTWSLDAPATSGLWTELEKAMALGCARTEAGGRVFPGMFEDMGDEVDPFDLLVVRPGTALRATPEKYGIVKARLDWTVTSVVENPAPGHWVKVQLPDGPAGWVETDLTISPIDYRLVSDLRDGRWRITAFVAGD